MKLSEFIKNHSFATLITQVGTIQVSHLNLIMDKQNELYLYGHLALANPQKDHFAGKPKALAIFSKDALPAKEEEEFAYFVHGVIELIEDQEQKC